MDFSKITILVVDDEPDLAELSSESFEIEGFHVFVANDGNQAIEIFNNNEVDLIFSDSIMPEMNGEELLQKIHESGKKMPLFYLVTGKVEVEVDELKKIGLTDIISKPYDLDEVIESIKKIFENK